MTLRREGTPGPLLPQDRTAFLSEGRGTQDTRDAVSLDAYTQVRPEPHDMWVDGDFFGLDISMLWVVLSVAGGWPNSAYQLGPLINTGWSELALDTLGIINLLDDLDPSSAGALLSFAVDVYCPEYDPTEATVE